MIQIPFRTDLGPLLFAGLMKSETIKSSASFDNTGVSEIGLSSFLGSVTCFTYVSVQSRRPLSTLHTHKLNPPHSPFPYLWPLIAFKWNIVGITILLQGLVFKQP